MLSYGPAAPAAFRGVSARFPVMGVVLPRLRPGDEPLEVEQLARAARTPMLRGVTLEGLRALVARERPSLVVSASFDRILPDGLLRLARCLNVHYGLLPAYRGRATVNWAIINGEAETGVTIHEMEPELDAGRILFQEAVAIEPDVTVGELYARLNAIVEKQLPEVVQAVLDGTAQGWTQDSGEASYCCTRLPADGHIRWEAPTRQISALIRALGRPYPGAFTYLGGRRLVIWKADPVMGRRSFVGRVPGRVACVLPGQGVEVLTGDGLLLVREVQLEGEGTRPAWELIRSVRETLGLDVGGELQTLEARLTRLETLLERAGVTVW